MPESAEPKQRDAKPVDRRSDGARSEGEERLPFDVELERVPAWAHVASALVVLVGLLVAIRLVGMFAFLPFLIASSLGKRFTSTAEHVVVEPSRLLLGRRVIPRRAILDVWADEDDVEPRAAVAFGEAVEVAVLQFANREQARRFCEALATEPRGAVTKGVANDGRTLVAGRRPRPIDALPSLRFVALAAAFVGTGSMYGLFLLPLFALGVWNVVRAKQLLASGTELEIRTILGAEVHPYSAIEHVDVDAGTVQRKGGAEVHIPRSALRDSALASPPWLERARTRVLMHVRARVRSCS